MVLCVARTFLSRCRERQTVLLLKGKDSTFRAFCQLLTKKIGTKKKKNDTPTDCVTVKDGNQMKI